MPQYGTLAGDRERPNVPTLHPTLARLDDQIAWYDSKSAYNQRLFKWLKGLVIVSGALAPLSAAVGAAAWVPGVLGAVVVVVEGLQQLNQYQQLWTSYRSTAEALKHEKYLFLGHASPYNGEGEQLPLLAERVEELVSREHAKWVGARAEQRGSEPR
jgi:uncharacterized protein DUF4231